MGRNWKSIIMVSLPSFPMLDINNTFSNPLLPSHNFPWIYHKKKHSISCTEKAHGKEKIKVGNISVVSLLTANPKDDALYLITETAEGKKILFRITLNFLCIFFFFSCSRATKPVLTHGLTFTQFPEEWPDQHLQNVYIKTLCCRKWLGHSRDCFQNSNGGAQAAFTKSVYETSCVLDAHLSKNILKPQYQTLRKLDTSQSAPGSSQEFQATWTGWQKITQAHWDFLSAIFLTKSPRVTHTAPRNASDPIISVAPMEKYQ